jgi:hypothetical protein
MRKIFGFLPETKHFGSFVCISDSPNGGEKVKNQVLTVGAKQERISDKFCEKSKRMTDTLLVIFENSIACTACW